MNKKITAERRLKGPRFDANDLASILEVSSNLICICRHGKITTINAAGVRILAANSKSDLINRDFTDFLDPDYVSAVDNIIDVLSRETAPFPIKMLDLCGGEICAEISAYRARELDNNTVVILVNDVTRHIHMSEVIQRSEARYRKLVNTAMDLICVCKADTITFINEAGAKMINATTPNQIVGQPFVNLLHPDYRDIFAVGMEHLIKEGELLPIKLSTLDGESLACEMAITPFDAGFKPDCMIEVRDITAQNQAVEALYESIKTLEYRVKERTEKLSNEIIVRKKAEEKLKHMASHDGLTGLPNRALLMDRVKVALSAARRHKSKMAVLFVDLDGFKPINDTLGHDAGDALLKQVADRLLSCVREMDTVARIGGDEFVFLLADVSSRTAVTAIAKKALKSLSRPFAIDKTKTSISASIGISLYPANGETAKKLIKEADQAMYEVKNEGCNNYKFAPASRRS